MAKQAKIRLSWFKSISTDVVEQRLKVDLVGQGHLVAVVLPASVEEFVFNAPEKSIVHVEIVVSDGTNVSLPATLDFELADLTLPEPVTGLDYTILEISDDILP